MKRKTWNEYFSQIAQLIAARATCSRKHVGAVIVRDKEILATGYNGSMAGTPHCDEVGHLIEDNHCVRTIHAEINAIAQAAKHGVNILGSTIYITTRPCWNCFKVIVNSGIKRIYYLESYRDDPKIEEALEFLDIKMTWIQSYPKQET